ncbi:MAG: hypothetical protein ACPGUV_08160 [Polyangiales bacterium]
MRREAQPWQCRLHGGRVTLWQTRVVLGSALLTLTLGGCGTEARSALDEGDTATVPTTRECSTGPATIVDGHACCPEPHTHLDLINACTAADKVDKNPRLPGLAVDGSLPPLP